MAMSRLRAKRGDREDALTGAIDDEFDAPAMPPVGSAPVGIPPGAGNAGTGIPDLTATKPPAGGAVPRPVGATPPGGLKPQVQRPNGTSPNGAGIPDPGLDAADDGLDDEGLGGAVPPPATERSSAFARYGTGDIPGTEGLTYGAHVGSLEGFDVQRASNPTDGYEGRSTKNTLGRYFSHVDPREPGALEKVLAQPGFMETFPEAEIVRSASGDWKLDLGDGPIDVQRAGNPDGSGEAWQFDDGGGGDPMGAGGGQGGGVPIPGNIDDLAGGDALAAIQKALAEAAQGRTPFLDDAIGQELA